MEPNDCCADAVLPHRSRAPASRVRADCFRASLKKRVSSKSRIVRPPGKQLGWSFAGCSRVTYSDLFPRSRTCLCWLLPDNRLLCSNSWVWSMLKGLEAALGILTFSAEGWKFG